MMKLGSILNILVLHSYGQGPVEGFGQIVRIELPQGPRDD